MKIHTENEASVREHEGKGSNTLEHGIRFPDGSEVWDLRFANFGFEISDIRTREGRRATQESYLRFQKANHLKTKDQLGFITRVRKVRFEGSTLILDTDFAMAS